MSKDKLNRESYNRYLNRQMSAEEAHTFEREVLKDPFAQEALEGMESFDMNTIDRDLDKMARQIRKKEKKPFPWMRIAASIALIAVSSLAIWLVMEQQPVASNEIAMDQDIPEDTESGIDEKSTDTSAPDAESDVITEDIDEMEVVAQSADPPPVQKEENEHVEAEEVVTTPDRPSLAKEKTIASKEIADVEAEESTPSVKPEKGNVLMAREVDDTDDLAIDVRKEESLTEERQPVVMRMEQPSKQAKRKGRAKAKMNSGSFANANTRTITGKIMDETGDVLPGVNVVVKGTATGTTSDLDGNYQLNVNENTVLVYSFIGFSEQEIQVGDQSVIDVTLNSDLAELQEVVVTAMGIEDSDEVSKSYSAPYPTGGKKALKKFVDANLKYPQSALDNGIQGSVKLEVHISHDGSIRSIEVKKSLGYGCDEEAIRLVKEGPKWNPADRNGNAASGKANVTIRFKR